MITTRPALKPLRACRGAPPRGSCASAAASAQGVSLREEHEVARTPFQSPFQTGKALFNTSQPSRSMAPAECLPLTVEKQVVFIRHGLSSWNEEGRIQGSSDISSLTNFGKQQAARTRAALQNIPFQACFSSPITRARQCAEIVWEGASTPIVFDDNLKEADLGWLQGLTNKDAARDHPEVYGRWRSRPETFEIDGHMPIVEVFGRARLAWRSLIEHPAEVMLVVTHKSILRALVCTALGLGPSAFRALDVHNAGVVIFLVNKDGEPMLQNLNLTSHLHHPDVRY